MCNHPTSDGHYIEYGVCESCQEQNYLKRKAGKSLVCSCVKSSSYAHYYKYGSCAACKKIQQELRRSSINPYYEQKIIKTTRKSIPKTLRNQVWKKSFETLKGICPVCNITEIEAFDFHCGHIISVKDGGTDTLDNLIAVCSQCNLSMSSMNLNEFKQQFFPVNSKSKINELEETINILNQEIINMKQMIMIMMANSR